MRIGDKVDPKHIVNGVPPVVLQVQPTGYVKVEKPEEIKGYEELMHSLYGRKVDLSGLGLHACETCSGGCSDDCGMY